MVLWPCAQASALASMQAVEAFHASAVFPRAGSADAIGFVMVWWRFALEHFMKV